MLEHVFFYRTAIKGIFNGMKDLPLLYILPSREGTHDTIETNSASATTSEPPCPARMA